MKRGKRKMAFIKGENVSTFKNLSTLLVQVLIFLSLIQGCSGDEQDSNESMSSDTSIADDFLSEDELAKLLKFSNFIIFWWAKRDSNSHSIATIGF